MAIATGNPVKFVYLSGSSLPATVDDATMYLLADAQQLYVGSQLIANNFEFNMDDLGTGAGFHNSIYRGKNLGSEVTAAQYAVISAGTFQDLYIGDYWTINGVRWRIAAFDYYYATGDIPCRTHHIVIVPDQTLYNEQMHWTIDGYYGPGGVNTTDGGYYNSNMRNGDPIVSEMIEVIRDSDDDLYYVVTTDDETKVTEGYETPAEAAAAMASVTWDDIQKVHPTRHRTLYDESTGAFGIIKNAFGENHILDVRKYLVNAVTSGHPSGGAWYDSTVELMTEQNVYGCKIFGPIGNGAAIYENFTTDKSQYPLFALNPSLIPSNRQWYWLRDPVSAAHFASVHGYGYARYHAASDVCGVRPAFSIIA